MIGKCSNCRFWGVLWSKDEISAPCERFRLISGDEKTEPDSAAIWFRVSDDHGLTVEFLTGADFGCIQFEPFTKIA